jgi:putative N6-adenine-specific DNA methylase
MKKNKNRFNLVAKTLFGLENILADELKSINAEEINALNRAVSFEGDIETLYKANIYLRTALRILKPITEFKARNENELYKNVYEINWKNYFSTKNSLAIDCVARSKYFKHSKYASLKVKDSIVDQFRKNTGKRPSIDVDDPDIRIHVHIDQDNCTISLDSSADSLHKRGYRLEKTEAPLNEVLAAGMIMLSGWNGNTNFIDPMCGSGTLVIEAAMIAFNIAPGSLRDKFGFMKWNDYDRQLWSKIKREANEAVTNFDYKIEGYDKSLKSIKIAKENVKRAKLGKNILIELKTFENQIPPSRGGVLITNPPYGERLKQNDINNFYKSIGDKLKQDFKGFNAWILSSNKGAIKRIGLRPSKKITLYNGPLECKFHKFELYEGSRKRKYNS